MKAPADVLPSRARGQPGLEVDVPLIVYCMSCGNEFRKGRSSATMCVPCRFWARVDKSGGPDACWPWLGKIEPNGYGRFKIGGQSHGAHRFAWELANGRPMGTLHGTHSCDRECCCNPAHIIPGTHQFNMDDMVAKGRSASGEQNVAVARPEALARGERHGSHTMRPTAPNGWAHCKSRSKPPPRRRSTPARRDFRTPSRASPTAPRIRSRSRRRTASAPVPNQAQAGQ